MRDRSTAVPSSEPPTIGVYRRRPPDLAQCRAPSCRKSIEWVTTENGRRMPVNSPLLVEKVIELLDDRQLTIIRADKSHFVTCPAAKGFRKRKAARG